MDALSAKLLVKDLPNHPGVYQMRDRFGTIIYIGKAKNIKKRVSQYFVGKRQYKAHLLVKQIASITPIITKTEHEALLLENELIKRHQPRFNVLLKDDKTYPYIKITMNEPFPRIIITRTKKNDGGKYFGPFTSAGSPRKLIKLLTDIFPIRDCKQAIDAVTHQKKCIKLDIGKCIGPCIIKSCTDEYNHLIQQCILLLSGKSQLVIDALRADMHNHAKQHAYEKAAKLRDHIQVLESIQQQQHVDLETNTDHFIIGFSSNEHYHYVVCQHFSNKRFVSQQGHYAAKHTPHESFVASFFQELGTTLPNKHVVVIDASYAPLAKHALDDTKKSTTYISPKKGRYHELLTIAQLNAQKSLIGISKHAHTPQAASVLRQLETDLNLTTLPSIIFGCDISHYYGTQIVSSVVVFIDGAPAKKWYRHFNITSITTGKSDDVKAMKETVSRLLKHYAFMPDLLLIDGGKGQLNAAMDALKSSPSFINCISLAKKNETIFSPFNPSPIRLAYHHAGLNLLRYVRDEAHRFALTFQRSKRKLPSKNVGEQSA
jgi:excinuclease ABC subunit C